MEDRQLLNIIKEFNKWLNRYWYESSIYKGDILVEWERITKDIDLHEISPEVKFAIEEKEREMKMKMLIEKNKRSKI